MARPGHLNPAGAQNITLAGVACPARTVCTAVGSTSPLLGRSPWPNGGAAADGASSRRQVWSPMTSASRVAGPAVSACYAAASYTNNDPSLTLTERRNSTGHEHPGRCRPVAPGALPPGLHPRRHTGLTSHQRPHPSRDMVPVPGRQLP